MSNNDSFIDEVTEAVRSDQLYGYLRRYGWIGVLVVVGLVGGAGWSEWQSARNQAAAQAVGDALLSALETQDPAARQAAFDAIPATGSAGAIVALLGASEFETAGNEAASVAALTALAADTTQPEIYRELAGLKAAMLAGGWDSEDARMAALQELAVPGRPFRLLAQEQIAFMQTESGDKEAAIATLRAIVEDADVTQGLRERSLGLIVALGGEITAPTASN